MGEGRWRSFRLALPAIAFGLALMVAATAGLHPTSTDVTVTFFDVGQGDGLHLRDGAVDVVVDGGPSLDFAGQLRSDMPATDRTLELVVSTHLDADHVTGLRSLVGSFTVARVLEPDLPVTTRTAEAWRQRVTEAKIPVQLAELGQSFTLPHGSIRLLWPPADLAVRSATNDHSIVLRIDVRGTCFLLTGDATAWVEAQLLPQDLRCDVLKVGHHGSASSTTSAFLNAVQPQDAVLSVGARNRYGHPAPSVVSRLQRRGIRIWRTDRRGTIRLHLTPGRPVWRPARSPAGQ